MPPFPRKIGASRMESIQSRSITGNERSAFLSFPITGRQGTSTSPKPAAGTHGADWQLSDLCERFHPETNLRHCHEGDPECLGMLPGVSGLSSNVAGRICAGASRDWYPSYGLSMALIPWSTEHCSCFAGTSGTVSKESVLTGMASA